MELELELELDAALVLKPNVQLEPEAELATQRMQVKTVLLFDQGVEQAQEARVPAMMILLWQ